MKLNDKKIVAVVGMCGAGKSELVSVFESRGYERIYFGGVTMSVLEERGLEKNEKNEKAVREELRERYGQGAFAVLLSDRIKKAAENGRVVLDGLYSWSEYKILKEAFGDGLFVVAVVCDKALRYERLAKRPVRPLTAAEAESRDRAEIENIEKGGPIGFADGYVLNNGTLEELRASV